MRTPLALAAIASAAAMTAGCSRSNAESVGPDISRSYPVGNFTAIETSGPYEVDVRTGAKPGVSATGSQKLLERTTVEVQGNRLVIRPERRDGWFHFGWGHKGHARFTVTVPQLAAATIAGSGDIAIDQVRGGDFTGSIAGSGGLTIGNVDVRLLKLDIGGSGSAKAGGGKAQSGDYAIAGSGDIDTRAVQTVDAKAAIAGSGSIQAHSSGTASAEILGSGDIAIIGGAKCTISKQGSGSVRCS